MKYLAIVSPPTIYQDASTEEARQPNDLRAIMESIQSLEYRVISLQLASNRQQMGAQSRRGDPKGFR